MSKITAIQTAHSPPSIRSKLLLLLNHIHPAASYEKTPATV